MKNWQNTQERIKSVIEAKNIVSLYFFDKKDKAGKPYIYHLERVSANFNYLKSEFEYNCFIVALLHDILEDCKDCTESFLKEKFNNTIVDAVILLTKNKKQSYKNYINAIKKNQLALHVKLADLKDNMDITRLPYLIDSDFNRLKKYLKSYHELLEHLNKNYN